MTSKDHKGLHCHQSNLTTRDCVQRGMSWVSARYGSSSVGIYFVSSMIPTALLDHRRDMYPYSAHAPATSSFPQTQYSSLHQERVYLLSALAAEEEQGERFNRYLESLRAKLDKQQTSDGGPSARKLKQAIKSTRHKLGKCQNRERILAANLTNIVAQMEGIKRYEMRNGRDVRDQSLQQAQMMLMSPALATFALQSPMNANLASDMQYMTISPPSTSGWYLPKGAYTPNQVGFSPWNPATPGIAPFRQQVAWHAPGTDHVQMPAGARGTEVSAATATVNDAISPFVLPNQTTPPSTAHKRAQSLPVISDTASAAASEQTKLTTGNDSTERAFGTVDATGVGNEKHEEAAEE